MRLAAAGVHVFTALGVVCALLAALAAAASDWQGMFFWLGVALVIDGADGALARWADVKHELPRFSGERLDLVIDYLTYVFIPVLALLGAGFLRGLSGLALAATILMSSLFHFSDTKSKSEDNRFVGFPAVWNIVAFYVFAFAVPPPVAAAIVMACVVLTFVPLRWVHPVRVTGLRPLTLMVCAIWAMAAMTTIQSGFPATPVVQAILLAVALYGIGLAVFWRHLPAGPLR